jgi:hypothetical protein
MEKCLVGPIIVGVFFRREINVYLFESNASNSISSLIKRLLW